MNKTFAELFPGSGGGSAVGGWTMPIFASKSITFTEAGTVVISLVSAGGGAATANASSGSATGGNSSPWGRKKFKVTAGDVLTITLAASVLAPAANLTNGTNGGTSTVALNGTTIMTVQGGEGGRFIASGTATALTPSATVTGADFWVPGVQAGTASGTAATSGGAAVDLLRSGRGRSPNSTSGAPLGGSLGVDTGGPSMAWVELAAWGVVVAEPLLATSQYGIPGRGAASSPAIAAGAFAGGVAGTLKAGFGAGAGGSGQGGGNAFSGDGYAFLVFTPVG